MLPNGICCLAMSYFLWIPGAYFSSIRSSTNLYYYAASPSLLVREGRRPCWRKGSRVAVALWELPLLPAFLPWCQGPTAGRQHDGAIVLLPQVVQARPRSQPPIIKIRRPLSFFPIDVSKPPLPASNSVKFAVVVGMRGALMQSYMFTWVLLAASLLPPGQQGRPWPGPPS